jgi:hypothetical protein
VIDTVGIKVAPFSTVDPFGTPHSKALHVVERYRLVDGEAAAEAQRKHGAAINSLGLDYGRGIIDPDTTKKVLQVEFTVEDPGVFTAPWSGRVTYRPVIGDWPEAICAENPFFLGSHAAVPTAHMPDFSARGKCRGLIAGDPFWVMGGRSDSVNGTSGVTSTADVSRRGLPLGLRANRRHMRCNRCFSVSRRLWKCHLIGPTIDVAG